MSLLYLVIGCKYKYEIEIMYDFTCLMYDFNCRPATYVAGDQVCITINW